MLDTVLVSLHVPAGAIAALSGVGAMFARKGGAAHILSGRTYLLSLIVVCGTGFGLIATRGPRFLHLAPLGIAALVSATIGYSFRRSRRVVHLVCMSTSYIVVLTAFYVDNGPKLPLWRALPPVAFWVLPSLVGAPLVLRAVRRNREGRRS